MRYLLAVTVLCISPIVFAKNEGSLGNRCGAWAGKFLKAQQAHDLEGFVSLFAQDYISFQPLGPQNSFKGSETVRAHWQGLFSLGLKQTGVPDFKTSTEFCAEEKQVDGSTKILMTQTWQGGFDVRGENPCLSLPVYMEVNVRNGLARRASIYFDPSAPLSIVACLPSLP